MQILLTHAQTGAGKIIQMPAYPLAEMLLQLRIMEPDRHWRFAESN